MEFVKLEFGDLELRKNDKLLAIEDVTDGEQIVIKLSDLPRLIHELQIIANEVTK